MKVVLCGYNWAGCKALDILLSQGHEVFVFTHKNPCHVASVIDICKKRKIPYSLERISQAALPFVPDIICSVYYRHIVSKSVIDFCGGKIFNLHPSLLPQYRGCSSLTWALINGDAEAGFTYHYIDEGCDTGPILFQQALKIEDWDTQQSLYMRVMFEGVKFFQRVFDLVAEGAAGSPQRGESSYYPRETPLNGEIDPLWDEEKIQRFIRAMNYPPYPPAHVHGIPVQTMDDYVRMVFNDENLT